MHKVSNSPSVAADHRQRTIVCPRGEDDFAERARKDREKGERA